MKLDVSLGVEGDYLKRMSTTARAAEALGFAGLWTSETKHDSFLPLAIAANEVMSIHGCANRERKSARGVGDTQTFK